MIPYQKIIDKYYESGSPLREILILHSRQVADKALAIAKAKQLKLNPEDIEGAAMLHDIGIFLTDAPGIYCYGKEPYLKHGVLGAELLRREGMPEFLARVAERHTGTGLTREEIISHNLPIPPADYLPETQLERLICFADKFYSKSGDMQEKSLERVRASMQKWGLGNVARFEALLREFS